MKKPVDGYVPMMTEIPRFLEHYENLPDQLNVGPYQKNWMKMSYIDRFAQDLMAPDFNPPFSGKFYGKPSSKQHENLKGLRMVRALRHAAVLMEERPDEPFWKCHKFCPEVDLIIKVVQAAVSSDGGEVDGVGHIAPIPYQYWQFDLLSGDGLVAAHDAINDLALKMRKALLSKNVREKIKCFKRNATDRYKHLMKVATSAWAAQNNSNLLIRLDWGYRKTYPVVLPEFLSQEDFHLQCAEVSEFRKIMLHVLQKMFGKDLAFYAWKIECGDVKGLHVHWLLAVNGNKHQDRINVPRQIADAWDAAIGKDKGYTFNVNALDFPNKTGLRVLDYNDPELLEVLGRYCDYLTKVDLTLKLRLPEKMRSFGSSKIQKVKKNKPGPARKYQMQMRKVLDVRGPQGKMSLNKPGKNK